MGTITNKDLETAENILNSYGIEAEKMRNVLELMQILKFSPKLKKGYYNIFSKRDGKLIDSLDSVYYILEESDTHYGFYDHQAYYHEYPKSDTIILET